MFLLADDETEPVQGPLSCPEAAFVLARFTGHGCDGCRIERISRA